MPRVTITQSSPGAMPVRPVTAWRSAVVARLKNEYESLES